MVALDDDDDDDESQVPQYVGHEGKVQLDK